MKKLFSLLFIFICLPIFADNKTLNVFAWSDFLPPEVVKQFEKETGITVHVSSYENNETLFAKLKIAKEASYDIAFPSSYFVERLVKSKLLKKLDKTQLPNFKHLDNKFINLEFDPNNDYSIPYLWTTVGMIINTKYHDKNELQYWKDLWKPKFKNKVLLLNESRDVFAAAMYKLNYSINEKDPSRIKDAYEQLVQLLPNVRLFNTATIPNIYIDEDITLGMVWSGEAYHAIQENNDLTYIYAKDGFPISLDCVAIPASAQNPKNAHLFINFMLRPDISAQLSIHTGGSTPNKAAINHLPKEIRENPVINPSQQILKRGKFQLDLGDTNIIYEKYWELLKVSA